MHGTRYAATVPSFLQELLAAVALAKESVHRLMPALGINSGKFDVNQAMSSVPRYCW
jgi:ABC-type microcin C transport system permease subunit YejB